MNKVMINGNLTRDPELRQTDGGSHVLSLSLANNERRKDKKTGEWKSHANFVDCVMFGPRVEGLFGKLSKGQKVTIEGKLHWSQWERDGQKRSKLEIVIDDIEFDSPKPTNGQVEQSSGTPATGQAEATPPAQTAAVEKAVFEEVDM